MLSDHPPSEVDRLRQAIAELQDERDKYRHNASKAMREAMELLVEKERLECENSDLKRTMRGLKEDIQRRGEVLVRQQTPDGTGSSEPRNATRDPRELRSNNTRDGNQHETGSLASRMKPLQSPHEAPHRAKIQRDRSQYANEDPPMKRFRQD
ncbi:hypothetical protein ARMSODRAFT_1026325 [Armillaria solidipes]|uniref:Uncharacterized protein n=1 Tax=Armillaria solidipes TaxID=1076256 RepID=A0A2H3BA79_9AGAR|nr:hypothetical protein ARMSODRAFT_1026325 [Armillaria solidipes]